MKSIIENEGISGLWKGTVPTILRSFLRVFALSKSFLVANTPFSLEMFLDQHYISSCCQKFDIAFIQDNIKSRHRPQNPLYRCYQIEIIYFLVLFLEVLLDLSRCLLLLLKLGTRYVNNGIS